MTTKKDNEKKMTIRVNYFDYKKIKETFYHGQQTQFFRLVFNSLTKLIMSGQKKQITDYLYNNKDLTLPGRSKK